MDQVDDIADDDLIASVDHPINDASATYDVLADGAILGEQDALPNPDEEFWAECEALL